MSTLLKNAKILTMTHKEGILEGDILIENGKIHALGKDIDSTFGEAIDLKGKIVLPSFINGHTHLAMVLMRNYKDSTENLQHWLSEIFPIEDKLNDDDIYWASLLGISEMIKSGCTTFSDMYFNTWQTAKACKESNVRGIIGVTFFGDENETKKRIRELVPRLEDAVDDDPNIRIDAAVHAIYTCTAGTYKLARKWADSRGVFINTHLSETKKEVDDCIKQFGMRPVEYLDSLGIFNSKTYCAHCVWLSDKEIDILSKKKVSIIHNPSSNCKLASGIAPVSKYIKAGINVSLGTDGASSNNNLNMLKEMNLASMLSSASTLKPSELSPFDVLKMATIDSARSLGLDDKIGTLEVGKDADLIVMDMDKVNTTPLNDPYSAIVFSSDRENIEYVFSKGIKLLEKGKLTTIDEDKTKRNVNRQWNDIKRR